ncbi:hypothetical protein BN1013_00063 [Candidatus Rubidus massiliensis]|nr:MAG: hypothetical protein BGO10_07285 [Chlamydia sp. 32-24]CDZ79569.1 hypothetical protein BN1013_00063 [Candidatus Rubidus massiliensis]
MNIIGALIGAIIGLFLWLVLIFFYAWILAKVKRFIKGKARDLFESKAKKEIANLVDYISSHQDFFTYLNDYIEKLISGLKNKIPMGSTLFTGQFSNKVKQTLMEEVKTTLPEVKKDVDSSVWNLLKDRLLGKLESEWWRQVLFFKKKWEWIIFSILLAIFIFMGAIVGYLLEILFLKLFYTS